jgi:monoamine oxidase
VLLTFAASATARRLLPLTEDEIAAATRSDLLKLYPDLADHIAEIRVSKWPRGIPAMRPGAYARLAQLRAPFERIHFCGDYLTYGPADLDTAIVSAEATAAELTRTLRSSPRETR